jgi:RHS repeat-associated protein
LAGSKEAAILKDWRRNKGKVVTAMLRTLLAEYRPADNRYYYYTSDQIGSTRIVTDQNGVVVYAAAHDPYGGIQQTWESGYDPAFKFSGKERDTESGLDYFGARYYDHTLYRFLSVDPVVPAGAAAADPLRWNLYAYCVDNPVNYTDPDGRVLIPVGLPGICFTFLDNRFYDKLAVFLASARQHGINVEIIEYGAYRTPGQQKRISQHNPFATKGTSLHECGFAVDIYFSFKSKEDKDSMGRILRLIAEKLGLKFGDSFREPWHLYEEPGESRKELSAAHMSNISNIFLI